MRFRREMNYQWRQVADELPDVEVPVIVAYEADNGLGRIVTVAFMTQQRTVSGIEPRWVEHEWLLDGVTHWQPMPEHPLDEEDRHQDQYDSWQEEDFGFMEPGEFSE